MHHLDHTWVGPIKKSATDHQVQLALRFWDPPWFWVKYNIWAMKTKMKTRNWNVAYSMSAQLNSAGQRSSPVRSWWKPRSNLELRASGGRRGWSLVAIQSRIGLFKLFVSSDRAPDAPLWSLNKNLSLAAWHKEMRRLTRSAILIVSSSEPFTTRSSSPGTNFRSLSNTRNWRLCLKNTYIQYCWPKVKQGTVLRWKTF